MATTLGSTGITFPDATTQTTAVPAKLSTASGSAPSYSARAWVNFNGTGTIAIRASRNISSITDVATGQYKMNFTTAMADANYSVEGCTNQQAWVPFLQLSTLTTGYATLFVYSATGDFFADCTTVTATIFR